MPANDSTNGLQSSPWLDFVSSIMNHPSGKAKVSINDLLPFTYGDKTQAEVAKAQAYYDVGKQTGYFKKLNNFKLNEDPTKNNALKVPIFREGDSNGYRAASNVSNLDGSDTKVYIEPDNVLSEQRKLIQSGKSADYGISELAQAQSRQPLSGLGSLLSHEVSHNNTPLDYNKDENHGSKWAYFEGDKAAKKFYEESLLHIKKPAEFSNALTLLQREHYQNTGSRLDANSLQKFIENYTGSKNSFDQKSDYSPDVQRVIKLLKLSNDGQLQEKKAYLEDAKILIPSLVQNAKPNFIS